MMEALASSEGKAEEVLKDFQLLFLGDEYTDGGEDAELFSVNTEKDGVGEVEERVTSAASSRFVLNPSIFQGDDTNTDIVRGLPTSSSAYRHTSATGVTAQECHI